MNGKVRRASTAETKPRKVTDKWSTPQKHPGHTPIHYSRTQMGERTADC